MGYMKNILFFLICCLSISCFAHSAFGQEVSYLQFRNHIFLCFDGKYIVHDPDCRCASRLRGFLIDKDQSLLEIELYRSYISDQD